MEQNQHFPDSLPPSEYPAEVQLTGAVHALYEQLESMQRQLRLQEETIRTLSTELILRGCWKPIPLVNTVLGFRHSCYLVCSYDFVNARLLDHNENPALADLKANIFRIFQTCFAPDYPCSRCEADGGLNHVLLNIPELTDALEQDLLSRADIFLVTVTEKLHISLQLSISHCCSSPALLPDYLKETERLRKLQRSVPECRSILYGGRLQLDPTVSDVSEAELLQAYHAFLRNRNIPMVHRCVGQLAVLAYQESGTLTSAIQKTGALLEEVQKAIGSDNAGLKLLLEVQVLMNASTSMDELLIAANQYFSALDQLLQSQAVPEKAVSGNNQLALSVREYLDVHFTSEALGLPVLSDLFGVSASQISRIFKKEFGVGVLSYLQQLRIHRAMELLELPGCMIPELVAQTGFSSRRTFDRVFRQYTGETAAGYRRTHRLSPASSSMPADSQKTADHF